MHLPGLDIDLPNVPAVCIGYIQDPDRNVTELHTVTNPRAFGANGLPLKMTLSLDPGEITGDVDSHGNAQVRLIAPDGRVSEFARAWVSIDTADGRNGVGWMEWNRNLPQQA